MSAKSPIEKITLLIICLFSAFCLRAQQYTVEYDFDDKDTSEIAGGDFLKTEFDSRQESEEYIKNLKELLTGRGYASASVDSVNIDSASARVYLFLGNRYKWKIVVDSLPADVKNSLYPVRKATSGNKIKYNELKEIETEILDYYENNGYPFAQVYSESAMKEDSIFTILKAEPRVLYHIDSIRNLGKAKIKQSFLQHYLDIFNGDIYNRKKLSSVNRLIDNLPYVQQVQAWDLMMLGTGSTLDLYLDPRRSSEVNALIGFLPGNSITGKTKVTADVRLNLKNSLGGGETILLNWQQLEPQSPRLQLGFNQPYIFNSAYGIDFSFGLEKRDSSWLQVSGRMGLQYMWSATRSISLFYQISTNNLLQGGLDTNFVLHTRRLPAYMDVQSHSIGLSYHFSNLNYQFNPRKGFDIVTSGTAGIRKVTPNNDILNLKDTTDPDFNFLSLYDTVRKKTQLVTFQFSLSHYSELGKNSVLKLAANTGWMISPQLYQNELFRIGGYKLLRGFDEESIFSNRYAVFTGEYRMLTGLNSFLFGFVDWGLSHGGTGYNSFSNSFVSTGLGLELETGFGLLNISYAIGKRNDIKFDLKNASKIHFGYINYF